MFQRISDVLLRLVRAVILRALSIRQKKETKMKRFLVAASLLLTSFAVSAVGSYTEILSCTIGGAGEGASSVRIHRANVDNPSAVFYSAAATETWLAGTHASGEVQVEKTKDANGEVRFESKDPKFVLVLHGVQKTDKKWTASSASGEFVDVNATNMVGRVEGKLTCK
jgi:hypothetical protein